MIEPGIESGIGVGLSLKVIVGYGVSSRGWLLGSTAELGVRLGLDLSFGVRS